MLTIVVNRGQSTDVGEMSGSGQIRRRGDRYGAGFLVESGDFTIDVPSRNAVYRATVFFDRAVRRVEVPDECMFHASLGKFQGVSLELSLGKDVSEFLVGLLGSSLHHLCEKGTER